MLEQKHPKHGLSASTTSMWKKWNQNAQETRNISRDNKSDPKILTVENR